MNRKRLTIAASDFSPRVWFDSSNARATQASLNNDQGPMTKE